MYALILHENGEKVKLGVRNIVSIVTYTAAAALGGFCPIAAYIVVAVVTVWWIFPEKKKKKKQ